LKTPSDFLNGQRQQFLTARWLWPLPNLAGDPAWRAIPIDSVSARDGRMRFELAPRPVEKRLLNRG